MITPSFTVLFNLEVYVVNYSLRSMYFQRNMLREQHCKQMDTQGTPLRLPACLLNYLISPPGKGNENGCYAGSLNYWPNVLRLALVNVESVYYILGRNFNVMRWLIIVIMET